MLNAWIDTCVLANDTAKTGVFIGIAAVAIVLIIVLMVTSKKKDAPEEETPEEKTTAADAPDKDETKH